MENYSNGRALPFIARVVEKNVDGFGGDAVMYVGFNKQINDTIIERFRQVLHDTKARFAGEDYDTESFVLEAVEQFNDVLASEHLGIRAVVINVPYDAVVTF